jgi:molybdopterin molybdotransferase
MEAEYLTVKESLSIVLESVSQLPSEKASLLDSLNRVLAIDVIAGDNLPPFSNSAMDGYAVRSNDVALAKSDKPVKLRVIADIAAGHPTDSTITSGMAARITTGAPLPEGADAVVPVEKTNERWRESERKLPDIISIYHPVNAGSFVRNAGEDIRAGARVLEAGKVIRAQEIAILASLGHEHVHVVGKPRVGLLATGDELIDVGAPLRPGKIRNSNSLAQAAQVLAAGGFPTILRVARDKRADVRKRLQEGLDAGVDLFVSSAGVSVGAHDVVRTVLEEEGNIRFWRVRMRPGKPLAFGNYSGVPFLGLPGNPVSAMVSFERFARPAILKMLGHKKLVRPHIAVRSLEGFRSDGRESYLRAIVERRTTGYVARLAGSQGSHMITSLINANALLIVPEGVESVEKGDQLNALMLDWPEVVL